MTPAPRPLRPWQALLIALTGFLIYAPAFHGVWLWDDPQYVTANPLLRDPAGLRQAWFVPGAAMEYYPLQQTAIFFQWRLWGGDPLGYHLTNIALHVFGGLLLARLFAQLGLRLAWLGGLLFVAHPMNVESVAWISELKNTLSLPPFLLAMSALLRFVDARRARDYALALGCFTLALLVKISMAPFPFVIVLYVWWRQGRVTSADLRWIAPFLFVAVALAATTVGAYLHFEAQHPGHPAIPPIGGPGARLALAGVAVSYYLLRCFWPWHPMPMTPQWPVDPSLAWGYLPALAWLGLLALLWQNRRGWGRPALVGVGFFLLMIAPFSGLATQSYMYFAWVMDHFLYLAMIGPLGLALAALERLRPAWVANTSGLLIAGSFAVQTWSYAFAWRNGEALWTEAVARNPAAWLAFYNLGNAERLAGDNAQAIESYRRSLALNPRFDWAHDNLGIALAQTPGGEAEAREQFAEAVRLRPHFSQAHNNLAILDARAGRLPEAIAEYKTALADEPDSLAMRYNLALALAQAGRRDEAIAQLREILRRRPDTPAARELLGRLGAGSP